jgi:thiamine-monophosphate kinase
MPYTETQLVNWLQHVTKPSQGSTISIGDDAALLATNPRGILVATDLLLAGVHFDMATTPAHLIGRKAVAVNFSDIAAMGGTPQSVFVSLGIPKDRDRDFIEALMLGISAICGEFACGIDGGDTNSWDGGLVINVAVTGSPHVRGVTTRGGALSGDVVMVSGQSLGGSYHSGKHLTFTPRVKEAQWLLDHFRIHSMMDLSDGLATDAPRLAEASRKQIIFATEAIAPDDDSLRHAFCDGEDFELLFTCDPKTAQAINSSSRWPCGFRQIGRVTEGQGVKLKDRYGKLIEMPSGWAGWLHTV